MVERQGKISETALALKNLTTDTFAYLYRCFPVCCESDEFYYFPQIAPDNTDWSLWDDFSPDRVQDAEKRLSRFEADLSALAGSAEDPDEEIDLEILRRTSKTLREQLTEIRFQKDQPTFYLTVACVGLAAALEVPDPVAWEKRVAGIPLFLSKAKGSLEKCPILFRDLGIEMARDTYAWLESLTKVKSGIREALSALEDFEDFLKNMPTRSSFLFPGELTELIVKDHIGCGTGILEVRLAIEEEIAETTGIMVEQAKKISPGGSWANAIQNITPPAIPAGGPTALYQREIEQLLGHCLQLGIVSPAFARKYPVGVAVVPHYLTSVRAASSYSFTPSGPSPGGTFFIVPRRDSWDNDREDLVDYRMLTAHETYPGHHLLDATRWHNDRPLRRPIEMPLFYEGWACFAEELMKQTGYFSKPEDLLLLAKRRYRRALRGLVDLDLQTGKMDIETAASFLVGKGFNKSSAFAVVPKYALRPGYQVCYTFGLRRFIELWDRYGANSPREFSQKVLAQGEVSFDHLEKVLKKSMPLEEKRDGST
ncbi:MAG: DUF885 family protein [Deltaproteobacteria bacterium]|nr:DUF885 family protein [Deltaproteobacteria bacterium]